MLSERIAFWLRLGGSRKTRLGMRRSQHYSILHIKSNLVKRDIEESETRASYPPLPLLFVYTQGGQNYSTSWNYFFLFKSRNISRG